MAIALSVLENPLFVANMVEANFQQNSVADSAAAVHLLDSILGRTVGFHYVAGSPDVPNHLIWWSRDTVVVLCGGVVNATMAVNVLGGWSSYAEVAQYNGFNAYAARLARSELLPHIPSLPGDNTVRISVGHSLGGLIVHALNYINESENGRREDAVYTTGSPRSLAQGYRGIYPDSYQAHFALLGDPIPTFPPRFSEAPELTLTAAGITLPALIPQVWDVIDQGEIIPVQFGLWPRFHHSSGHAWINTRGTITQRSGPSPTAEFVANNWTNANLAIAAMALLPSHELALYREAIHLWAQDEARVASKLTTPVEPTFEPFDVAPSLMLPVDVEGEHYMVPLSGVLPMQKPIETDTIPGPGGVRVGVLILRGEVIATFPNRSRARTAARYLNRFLSRLPAAEEVSLTGMQAGISAYLTDAAAGRGVDRKPVRLGN